jgi:hypothetical protein
LPPPVGITTSASRRSSAQSIASRCIGRSASKPYHRRSAAAIAASRPAAPAPPAVGCVVLTPPS